MMKRRAHERASFIFQIMSYIVVKQVNYIWFHVYKGSLEYLNCVMILLFKNNTLHLYTFFHCSVYSHIVCVSFLYTTGASNNDGCQHYFRFYCSTTVCIVFLFLIWHFIDFVPWHRDRLNQPLSIFPMFLSCP